ncbi:MAG: response regulator [Methanobacteriota archaeon]|nr:MAG: response regulator [Euryarchaeota archaeon]
MARIMVVDDARFMLMVIEKLLRKMGHDVVYRAVNGEDAINIYAEHMHEIDLVTLDVVMPKMDGLQVLKRILTLNPSAKVVMVTSISSPHIVQPALRAGAKDFVTKPFRLSQLAQVINNVLDNP